MCFPISLLRTLTPGCANASMRHSLLCTQSSNVLSQTHIQPSTPAASSIDSRATETKSSFPPQCHCLPWDHNRQFTNGVNPVASNRIASLAMLRHSLNSSMCASIHWADRWRGCLPLSRVRADTNMSLSASSIHSLSRSHQSDPERRWARQFLRGKCRGGCNCVMLRPFGEMTVSQSLRIESATCGRGRTG